MLYLRLLTRQVESLSGGGGGPSAPSLVVPVLVVLIFKRWCALAQKRLTLPKGLFLRGGWVVRSPPHDGAGLISRPNCHTKPKAARVR